MKKKEYFVMGSADFEKWDQLKALLMVGVEGSKIVVTTQSHAAESVMQSAFTINLQPLGMDESM